MDNSSSIFHTEQGPLLVLTKSMGANQVPLGCFYDDGAALGAMELFLKDFLYPFFKILPERLKNELRKPKQISYRFWLLNQEEVFNNIEVDFEPNMINFLKRYPIDRFEGYLNIEVPGEDKGIQINFFHDIIHYSNFDETEEYPVHAIFVGQTFTYYEKFILESHYDPSKLEKIYKLILSALK